MKLSISNIAWDAEDEDSVLDLLASYSVQGIEVAPTKIWSEWQGITEKSVQSYRAKLANRGFKIPALQAILFAQPEAKLFGTEHQRQYLLSHLRFVTDVAKALGAEVMVFGAPRNRDKGQLSEMEADAIAKETFKEIGDYCANNQVCLCIEPNPTYYNCNYITNSDAGLALVETVNSAGFGLHLDSACMFLAQEAIESSLPKKLGKIKHFHIADRDLSGIYEAFVDHHTFATILNRSSYKAWLSIETKAQKNVIEHIEKSINFVLRTYF